MSKLNSLTDVPAIADYLKRIGAEPRSIRTAVIKRLTTKGYWIDEHSVSFSGPDGVVKPSKEMPDDLHPTEAEKDAIKIGCGQFEWPVLKLVANWNHLPRSKEMEGLLIAKREKRIFEFRTADDKNVIMWQERGKPSDKWKYRPWTLWDDDEIRCKEPDGLLPLWGLEQLKGGDVVVLHEGAKAAKRMADMVAGRTQKDKDEFAKHPFFQEMKQAFHLGWIGGAENPNRTDWSALKEVARVIIVSDNDSVGRKPVPKIAKHLKCPTYHVQFTRKWPASFDLGDRFPDHMFAEIDGVRRYIGDPFNSLLHPATWATNKIEKTKASPERIFLRDHFVQQWAYVEFLDVFVNLELPDIIRPAKVFNNMLRPFSDTPQTAALLLNTYNSGRIVSLSYKPDEEPGFATADETSSFNVFRPTSIKPDTDGGDPAPFLEYMAHMFPNEGDRKKVERWCATLIAKPEVRMEYGLLMVSEMQGVGKNTLGAKILAPLVGIHNTGFPNESSIVDSPFNSWLAKKRLVFVGEVYSGHSWKAYNKLKALVTDKEVDVNEKHIKSYKLDSWAHFCLCSNSLLALKMEPSDRRWLMPTVTEVKWSKAQFDEFYTWLMWGGLSIIYRWALDYGDYVTAGEAAPMTTQKAKAIEASLSDEERDLKDLCEILIENGKVVAFSSKELMTEVKLANKQSFLTALHLGKAMMKGGMKQYDGGEITMDGGRHLLFLSPKANDQIAAIDDPRAKNERLRKLVEDGRLLRKDMKEM